MTVFWGLMIPLAGTTLGSACVFFLKDKLNELLQKGLLGFASGVMVAASVWSLLIPSMDMAAGMGRLAFVPAAAGMLLGMAFLLGMDRVIPHLHLGTQEAEGPKTSLKKTTMLVLAVTLHNIPEGMAVGVVFAGMLSGSTGITAAGAFSLAIGIAIQNFPEGAIISMPLKSEGQMSRKKAFLASVIDPFLPYLLSFAAGAMLYVVVEELIPEASEGEHSNLGTVGFAVGFVLMMVLDVALG